MGGLEFLESFSLTINWVYSLLAFDSKTPCGGCWVDSFIEFHFVFLLTQNKTKQIHSGNAVLFCMQPANLYIRLLVL